MPHLGNPSGPPPPPDPWTGGLSALTAALGQEIADGEVRLAAGIEDLQLGSLRRHDGLWLNGAAACPVPRSVVTSLTAALEAPHVTLQRGTDPHTLHANATLEQATERFNQRYGLPGGRLIMGHNTTHLLMALSRAYTARGPMFLAHGEPDHRASYLVSELPGWSDVVPIRYSETGFYERRTTAGLSTGTLFLLSAQHPIFGTVQRDALAALPAHVAMLLDMSQALKWLAPAQLQPFLARSDAAVFSLGKTYSPMSAGVAWIREEAFAARVLKENPELTGSVSSLSIAALSSTLDFLERWVDGRWSAHVFALTRYLLLRLSELPHVSVIGCASHQENSERTGIVSIRSQGMSAQELGLHLEASGFIARADGSCTGPTNGDEAQPALRISLLPHVRQADLDRLVLSLASCV